MVTESRIGKIMIAVGGIMLFGLVLLWAATQTGASPRAENLFAFAGSIAASIFFLGVLVCVARGIITGNLGVDYIGDGSIIDLTTGKKVDEEKVYGISGHDLH